RPGLRLRSGVLFALLRREPWPARLLHLSGAGLHLEQQRRGRQSSELKCGIRRSVWKQSVAHQLHSGRQGLQAGAQTRLREIYLPASAENCVNSIPVDINDCTECYSGSPTQAPEVLEKDKTDRKAKDDN